MAELTSKLCVEVLQKIQEGLIEAAKDRWQSEEGLKYLTAITGDYQRQDDMRVRTELYMQVRPKLDFIQDSALHDIFDKELRYMLLEYETRAVKIVFEAPSWMSYWENICYMLLVDTGVWRLEFTDAQRQNSSFYLWLTFKREKPEALQDYLSKKQLVLDFLNGVSAKTREIGTIETYNTYVLPLKEKGLTWTAN